MKLSAEPAIISTTNFDLPSVHMLLPEIDVALKDAETSLSEFYDDKDKLPLLQDSATVLEQLAAIFGLIRFKGASELADAIAKNLNKLHTLEDANDHTLIMDISEGIMILGRYVEFVLLKEMLEPSLLLPIINKLRAHLGEPDITSEELFSPNNSISITNPQSHYQSLVSLGLDVNSLVAAYRAGLGVVLSKDTLDANDRQKVEALSAVCQEIASHSDTLFWQSAAILTHNLVNQLPLSNAKKRVLIYIEQQLKDYLPIHDRRFADLVGFACGQSDEFAQLAQKKYGLNQFSKAEQQELHRFLFGPDREITDTLNTLIQDEIIAIKEKVDALVRNDELAHTITTADIAKNIHTLSQTLQLINLGEAADALASAAAKVSQWQTPTPDDFDDLLAELMIAENAAIFMAKTHTPGAVKLPLHNRNISLHQLDTAYDTLIKESRTNLATVCQAITDYIADDTHDKLHLQNTPEALAQVVGAAEFLRLPIMAQMLRRLSRYLDGYVSESAEPLNLDKLAQIADVIVAADYQFEGQEYNRPINKQALHLGTHSLNRLVSN